jgi:hypothetical protein
MTNAQVKMWVCPIRQQIYTWAFRMGEGSGSAEVIGFVTDANRGKQQRNGTHRKKKMRGCLVSVKTNRQLLWLSLETNTSRKTFNQPGLCMYVYISIHLQLMLGNSCHDWTQPFASYPDQSCVTADLGRRRAKKGGSPPPSKNIKKKKMWNRKRGNDSSVSKWRLYNLDLIVGWYT